MPLEKRKKMFTKERKNVFVSCLHVKMSFNKKKKNLDICACLPWWPRCNLLCVAVPEWLLVVGTGQLMSTNWYSNSYE